MFQPDTNGQMFIPVGNDSTQTTTSTTYEGVSGTTFLVNPRQLHGGEYVKARLWIRGSHDTGGETVYFRVYDGVDMVEIPESETTFTVSTGGNWVNEFGPEFRLLEELDTAAKDYSLRWKVDAGTAEVSGGAGLGVLLYW